MEKSLRGILRLKNTIMKRPHWNKMNKLAMLPLKARCGKN
jgi:hypothetical protein